MTLKPWRNSWSKDLIEKRQFKGIVLKENIEIQRTLFDQ